MTSGGIIGKVAKVDENELQVEIADGVKIKVVRSTVSEVRGKGEAAPGGEGKGRLMTDSTHSPTHTNARSDPELRERQCCIFKDGR